MNRIAALAAPFLVLVSVMVTFAWFETRKTPDWELALNEYVAWSRLSHETIKIQAVAKAGQPWNFRATMGRPVQNDWPWGIARLPYPPTAVQCVLLEREAVNAAGEPVQQVVYVGYHTDTLWRAGWLVQEGPQSPFTLELVNTLTTIGCDLDLGSIIQT
jgi:hypothetical protein